MDRDVDHGAKQTPPPDDLDIDEGLDEYDEELSESFPASDPPNSVQP